MKTYRIILHIDMNCFFASCEIAENPLLKGKPIVVAHDDQYGRGIILSPSYEARRYGIKTTMKVKDAYKLYPNLIVVAPNHHLYQEKSNAFYQYFLTITNKVEMVSIDEAFLDVTDLNLGDKIIDKAKEIQMHLLNVLKLPCSIGIAPNKLLAKMASDMKKPMGITILRKREVPKLLWPLPISDLFGVGKKTASVLSDLNIITIGDLANYQNIEELKDRLGPNNALGLIDKAFGNDSSEVEYLPQTSSSVSAAHTFEADIFNIDYIKQTLKGLSNTVCYRLQNERLSCFNIGIQIKYANFSHFSKSHSFNKATNDERDFYRIVVDLIDEHLNPEIGVRLVGVFANRLTEAKEEVKQISIFDNLDDISKDYEIKKLLNSVKKTFGNDIINKGYYEYKSEDKK